MGRAAVVVVALSAVCATALPMTSAKAAGEARRPGTRPVSAAADGPGGDSDPGTPRISANGRYVAFGSRSANLVPGDTDGRTDVFARAVRRAGTACPTGAAHRAGVRPDLLLLVISRGRDSVFAPTDATLSRP
ncbi:hypothetical protein ABZ760_32025 [Streptomyces sp. NPDC006658]|uniref:hypothetical protein n=1 Tax=Streptomyces sp. NPDC006658 TaxID=3156900 RepID=UPI00340A7FF3